MTETDPEEQWHSWSTNWKDETVTLNDEQITLLPEWTADEVAEVTDQIQHGYSGSGLHIRLKLLRALADALFAYKEERERRAYAPWYNR